MDARGTIDVAHEALARRWTYGERDGALALDHWEMVAADRDASGTHVGRGSGVRVAVLAAPDTAVETAARRALLAAGANVVSWLRSDDSTSFPERVATLRAARADLAVVLAGDAKHADGVVLLCEALRAGCADQSPAPRAVVAGDARTTLRLHGTLLSFGVEVLPDPRKADGRAALVGRVHEFRWGTERELVLRDDALRELALGLAAIARAPALVADVGGATTSLVQASPDGTLIVVHATGIGVGRGADRVVTRAGLDRVRRWIPRAVDEPGLLERVFNRARWPDAVAADPLALLLEIALAHEAIAHALDDATGARVDVAALRRSSMIALTGRAAALPRPAQSLLIALDAIQPTVLCSVLRDRDDALVAAGGLAAAARLASRELSAQWLARELIARHEPLALVAPFDRTATLRIVSDRGRRDEKVEVGAFRALPIHGAVDLSARGTALRGRGVVGPLGLVIDARGRPLALPTRDAERIPAVARWSAALDALPGGTE